MARYLMVPGWGGSGKDHWQTHWERELSGARRVQMPDWLHPKRVEWIAALDRAVRASASEASGAEPPILIAHSLGCLAVAAWAATANHVVRGALLVAPPDVDRGDPVLGVLQDFAQVPRDRLPFPSIVVASDDDPYASITRSARMAREWGSQLTVMTGARHINTDAGFGPWADGRALLRYFDDPLPLPHAYEADDPPGIFRGLD